MNTISLRKIELENCSPIPTMDESRLNRFWDEQLARHEERPMEVTIAGEDTPYPGMKVNKVTYKGFDETPVHAWHIAPVQAETNAPCVVTFPGYTMDRGFPERYAHYLLLGWHVLAVDVRGQSGETGSLLPLDSGIARGWITQGIMEAERSYYMAVTIDAMRAVKVAAGLPGVDAKRIATAGGSQGGGLAFISGALSPLVAAVAADIPNLCRMDYGVLHSTSSLTEVAQYIKRYPDRLEAVLSSLAHFDMLNLAPRLKVPVMVSVGWKDTVCMPETIYAAYNRVQSPKEIRDYPFSGHEVSEHQKREAVVFLQKHLG
ncbi:acetylxylan esterase [Paenibacillus sp. JSM ZJ436]|uniref:acetylxylan esterase n=1 Tax=Paenibacillus sp. JSM ZJ436 TaxID=3376190 RepID=UPI0037891796